MELAKFPRNSAVSLTGVRDVSTACRPVPTARDSWIAPGFRSGPSPVRPPRRSGYGIEPGHRTHKLDAAVSLIAVTNYILIEIRFSSIHPINFNMLELIFILNFSLVRLNNI